MAPVSCAEEREEEKPDDDQDGEHDHLHAETRIVEIGRERHGR